MTMTIDEFFRKNTKVALAFSGGVDSAYLLYAAMKAGADIRAYYVKTAFQPQRELNDAIRLAQELGAPLKILSADVLSLPSVASNPPDRCYHCKLLIMSTILQAAADDGYSMLIDGTNASDDVSDRPGMRALAEMNVRSPLRECLLTKDEIRKRSREAGLFTWDKPAYACLATRIPSGEPIDSGKLCRTENAEELLSSLGFCDFRVRYFSGCARIQIRKEQFPLMLEHRDAVMKGLKELYKAVLLDLEARDE